VWDFDFDGDPNIVEIYVGRLRTKLRLCQDQAVIETVRGSGYGQVGSAEKGGPPSMLLVSDASSSLEGVG
jgi:Transcriptional regulatory protein, C terminal